VEFLSDVSSWLCGVNYRLVSDLLLEVVSRLLIGLGSIVYCCIGWLFCIGLLCCIMWFW